MRVKLFLTSFLAVAAIFSNAQNVNTERSKVTFEVSNMAVNTVEGSFSGMMGSVELSEDNINSIDVCIDPSKVSTDSEKRDAHLRNPDFFDVEQYKEICFVSNKIERIDAGFMATGMLTMHGISKEVSIPLTLEKNSLKGELTIDRYDFKVGEDGSFSVGREVKLMIICELESKK